MQVIDVRPNLEHIRVCRSGIAADVPTIFVFSEYLAVCTDSILCPASVGRNYVLENEPFELRVILS